MWLKRNYESPFLEQFAHFDSVNSDIGSDVDEDERTFRELIRNGRISVDNVILPETFGFVAFESSADSV